MSRAIAPRTLEHTLSLALLVAGFALALVPAPAAGAPGDGDGPDPEERVIVIPRQDPATATAPPVGTSVRLAGDPLGDLRAGGTAFFRVADCLIDTALPQGYPPPTVPGCVELKTYPVVRRAEVSGRSAPDLASSFAFFRLFQHIQDRDIAMTSPVEMDYRVGESGTGELSGAREVDWTMSFLYRTRELGETGEDGRVTIIDRPEVTVLSIGLRGDYGAREVFERLEELRERAAAMPGWEVAGEPRGFFYNGPSVPSGRKWGEAQLPVRERDVPEVESEDSAEPAERRVFLQHAEGPAEGGR